MPCGLSSATPRCTPLHYVALCGALLRVLTRPAASCRALPRPAGLFCCALLHPVAPSATTYIMRPVAPCCVSIRTRLPPTTLTAPLCHLRRPLQRAVAPCCALQHPAAPCSALRRPAAPCNALLAALFASCLSLLTASLLAASLLAASLLAAPLLAAPLLAAPLVGCLSSGCWLPLFWLLLSLAAPLLAAPLLAAPLLAAPLVGCPSSGCSSVGCPSSGCSSVGCLSSGCSSASLTYSIISDSLSDSLSLTL